MTQSRTRSHHGKMAIGYISVAGVLALLGGANGQQCTTSSVVGDMNSDRMYTIAVGHDWGAHEYIDTDGYIRGFNYDLIAAVCEAGGMKCRTVWDKYSNCWDSTPGQHSFGGQGLMSRWYDACTGWMGTVGRMQVMDFSMPFNKPTKVFFFTLDNKAASFDVYDISSVKAIGFIDGWFSDEKCLARQTMIEGHLLPVEKVKHYATTDEITTAIMNGEIDAFFAGENNSWGSSRIVQVTNTYFMCANAGNAMMTRKDNDFNAAWNVGFQQIVADGRFSRLCLNAKQQHGDQGDLTECV